MEPRKGCAERPSSEVRLPLQTSAPIQSREMTPEEVESPIEPLAGSEQPLITPEETTNDEVPGGTILEDTVVSPVEPQQTTPEPVETLDNLEKQSDDDKLAKITAEIMEGMNDETDAPHNQTVLQAEDQEGGISQPAAAVDIFQDVMSRLQNAGTQQNPSNPEPGNDQIAAMPGNVSDWVKVESPASEITTPSLAEENAPDSIAPEPPAFEPLSKTLELPENSTMPREYNNPADDLSLAQPSASAANNPFQATQPEIASPSPTQADSPEEIMGDLVLPWEEPPVEQGITSPISVKTNASVDVSRTQPVHVNPPAPARENPPGGSPGLDSSYRRTISHLLSHQSYTCLLVPRLSETPIYPELAHFLGEQMTQIASVFGWQLGSIHIQSDYMLWSVQVMPNVPVGNIIRIIRQRTSKRIFTQYPDLAKINDLGDFWAPGFLSANSTVPPPDAAIADFINQTRRRQELLRALEA